VADLARRLTIPNLSVVAAPGFGPMQNLARLLDRRDAQVAVLQADLLDYLERRRLQPGAAQSLRYIAQLYSAPVHVLAQQNVTSITQLTGQKVSLGLQDSVSFITGSQLFPLLGVSVQPVPMDDSEALGRLRRRELAALVYVGETPERTFSGLNTQQDGVRFVPLPLMPRFSGTYLPAQLTIQDYPLLIGQGEAGSGMPVPTIAVPMLLAVYNWPAGTPVHRTLSLFAQGFSRIAPITLEPPGWTKFVPSTAPIARSGNEPRQLTSDQRKALFEGYASWREQRQREALFEDYLRWLQSSRQLP
jgi:hypothetical protein